jgi:hypothetical protein
MKYNAAPDNGTRPTRDTSHVIELNLVGGRVMRDVGRKGFIETRLRSPRGRAVTASACRVS